MSKGRPAGVLANEVVKILDRRNPQPLQGIPRGEESRQQIGIMLDDLALLGDVDRMRKLARGFAPWLADEDLGGMIDHSLTCGRRWNRPDEIAEMAELFQLSETERDALGIRQIRPVHADGSAFDDKAMMARRRAANKISQRERRRDKIANAQEQNAAAAYKQPKLTQTELLIYEKIDPTWRSTTAIAKAVKRGHRYEGQKSNLISVRKAVNRASEKLIAAGLVEKDDTQKGANGQPLRLLRRLIVHAKSVSETSRHAENADKIVSPEYISWK
jgi:hypothetical protein